MSNGQCFAIRKVQLEGTEGRSISHFFKVRDFHIPDSLYGAHNLKLDPQPAFSKPECTGYRVLKSQI
jgi:hypothetical protein